MTSESSWHWRRRWSICRSQDGRKCNEDMYDCNKFNTHVKRNTHVRAQWRRSKVSLTDHNLFLKASFLNFYAAMRFSTWLCMSINPNTNVFFFFFTLSITDSLQRQDFSWSFCNVFQFSVLKHAYSVFAFINVIKLCTCSEILCRQHRLRVVHLILLHDFLQLVSKS